MDHYIVYEGKRVALAAMRREYIEILMKWINNPEVVRGVMIKPPVTLESEIAWYESIGKNSANIIFAILLKKDDGSYRYIGHTGLHNIMWPAGRGGTGSLIGDIRWHGKGLGTEAKLLLLHHAFNVVGLRKVTSEVKAFNGNSFGHLLKCGYKVVGHRKEHHFCDGHHVDEILFEIFRKDFEPIWNAYRDSGELPSLTPEQRNLMGELMHRESK
jgi:RimJ/RimL family protein N-acetyltransferase